MMTTAAINRYLTYITTVLLFIAMLGLTAHSQAASWPQELTGNKGTIVIYQPQPEKLQGNTLIGRAAMQLELNTEQQPIFGVFWFSAKIETDRDTNSVVMSQIKVSKVTWPESNGEQEKAFTVFVEKELQNSSFVGSLSKLTATLANAEKVEQSLQNIKNDPPKIIFNETLAVLLTFDGKPIFKAIEKTNYERALNTPFAVVKTINQEQYYLTSGSLWYQATNALGPWKMTENIPADLQEMFTKDNLADENKPDQAPNIVVTTEPTELVVTDGNANWVSLVGGQLLYVDNTETPWLRELSTGNMYILLSGRWFKSKSLQGPWAFVRADKLPASFKSIPPESDIGGLRSSVAGTEEAEQAVLDAQIPQTAAIKRSEAKLTVEYDGAPQFEKIKGTSVEYAVNTSAQVLKIAGKYYAVDNGVWFVSDTPNANWQVADDIPDEEISTIPPSAPVYNTTYVKIYDSTPEVVYVGYTPGYMWSYPYYGVPIYGTGWYYPPYYGGWYYPRPPTWGLHVGYNPWTGWSVGVSWGSPFFRVGVRWNVGYHGHYRPCCGGYHGGFYGGHRANININGNVNIGNSVSIGNRNNIKKNIVHTSGNRAGNLNKANVGSKVNNNIYNRSSNKHRNASEKVTSREIRQAKPAPKRANNVFADRSGNVIRHKDGQWQNRSNKNWKTVPKQVQPKKIQSKPNQRQLKNLPKTQQPSHMNRDFNHQNMNRARQARGMGGGFGAGRGGFGGRR